MPAMASRSGSRRRSMNEINMVPFIDVMLVLLIIFMVTAPMLTPSAINVPSVGKGAKPPKTFGQVIIQKDGSLTLKTDGNELIFKTNMGAGHGGKSGRFESLRETAEEFAFILWQLGIPE